MGFCCLFNWPIVKIVKTVRVHKNTSHYYYSLSLSPSERPGNARDISTCLAGARFFRARFWSGRNSVLLMMMSSFFIIWNISLLLQKHNTSHTCCSTPRSMSKSHPRRTASQYVYMHYNRLYMYYITLHSYRRKNKSGMILPYPLLFFPLSAFQTPRRLSYLLNNHSIRTL